MGKQEKYTTKNDQIIFRLDHELKVDLSLLAAASSQDISELLREVCKYIVTIPANAKLIQNARKRKSAGISFGDKKSLAGEQTATNDTDEDKTATKGETTDDKGGEVDEERG